MSWDTLDVENPYVRRIQQMRSEVLAFNEGREPSYGPISHALEILPSFSRSTSDWSTDHLCRFQVVITDEHPDEPMFPAQYMPADEDKTLNAISEDGFFLSPGEIFPLRSSSTKLHSAFFMDLLQITAEGESMAKNENSTPILEPNASSSHDEQKTAIAKALHYAKGLASHSETVQFLAHSLIHNFLKYVASIEHLAYPDLTFWCPRYDNMAFLRLHLSADSEVFSIDAAGAKFLGYQDGAVYTWVRRSTKHLKRKSIPLCFIEVHGLESVSNSLVQNDSVGLRRYCSAGSCSPNCAGCAELASRTSCLPTS